MRLAELPPTSVRRRRPRRGLLAALLAVIGFGCAGKPHVEPPPVPVPVGCGEMPPPPVLCIETMAKTATPDEKFACWIRTSIQLQTDDLALRAQFAPCAISSTPPR